MSVTIIKPGQRSLGIAEAFARRELLYFLIWRDIKIRYKQTVLGATWAVLVPVIQVLIFTVVFGTFAGIEPDGEYPYALFVLAGLIPWTFFSQAVTQGSQSLLNQQHVITKVYFPRLFVPAGAVGGCVVDYMISFGVYAVAMLIFGYAPSLQILMLPLVVLWSLVVSLGVVFLLSALTITYRDFRYVIPVMIQTLMYMSPVVYPVNLVPESYRWLLGLNPMAGVIEAFRVVLLAKECEWATVGVSVLVTLVFLAWGLIYFRSTERRFADIA